MFTFKTLLQRLNLLRLVLWVACICTFAFISFFVVFANEEGGLANNVFMLVLVSICKYYFLLLSFPALYLIQALNITGGDAYFLAIIADCVIFGLIVELLIFKWRSKHHNSK